MKMINTPIKQAAPTMGKKGEQYAQAYLETQGFRLITKNYHSRFGEIDLIMDDGWTLIFVEVRVRNHQGYGSALESVTPKKQEKIWQTAEVYLQEYPTKRPVRLDVIGIEGLNTASPTLEWVKSAF